MGIGIVGVLAVSVLAISTVGCKTTSESRDISTTRIDDPKKPGNGATSIAETLKGMSWTAGVDKSSGISKTEHHLVATPTDGTTETASVIAKASFKAHKKNKPAPAHPDCPAEYKWGAELVKLTWSQTYADGSVIEGKAKDGAATLVCTDGSSFYVEVSDGEITKGKGQFANVTGGTWNAEITVGRVCNEDYNFCPSSGNFEATLGY